MLTAEMSCQQCLPGYYCDVPGMLNLDCLWKDENEKRFLCLVTDMLGRDESFCQIGRFPLLFSKIF